MKYWSELICNPCNIPRISNMQCIYHALCKFGKLIYRLYHLTVRLSIDLRCFASRPRRSVTFSSTESPCSSRSVAARMLARAPSTRCMSWRRISLSAVTFWIFSCMTMFSVRSCVMCLSFCCVYNANSLGPTPHGWRLNGRNCIISTSLL